MGTAGERGDLPRRTVLLTGGRAPATLDLARCCASAGWRVIVAESLRWPITRWSNAVTRHYRLPAPRQQPPAFVTGLLDIVRRECVDVVVPTCEEVFHLARHGEALRRQTAVLAAPFTQLRRLHSKCAFVDAVRAAGLRAPVTRRVTCLDDAARLVEEAPGQLVLKPEFSRFATQTIVGPRSAADLSSADISSANPWVAQEFVEGVPVCNYAVAHAGRLTAHAAYAVRYTAGLASSIHFAALNDPRVEAWTARFVAAEAFTGQIAFDFMMTGDGAVVPIECNPRSTSGVHLLAGDPAFARALTDPSASLLRPPPGTQRMLAIPMLGYGLRQARARARLAEFGRDFVASRDVVWRWTDPGPAAGQALAMLELFGAARRGGRSVLAASTADIEYNGEDVCESS